MRIALVAFESELSWGLRNIAEYLRSRGYSVSLYFLERYTNVVHSIPEATMDAFLWDFRPGPGDVVGIGFITPYLEDARKLCEKVRKEGAAVVVGGVHPTILPEDCTRFSDYIIRGAGEEAMLSLIKGIEKGGIPEKGVYPSDDKFWFTEDVSMFPYPRYGVVEDSIIVSGTVQRTTEVPQRVGPIVRYQTYTSFGCPYSCSYCINPLLQNLSGRHGKEFIRRRDISSVIGELQDVRDRIDTISFEDEDFLTNLDWLKAFLREYREKIGLPFGCLASPATFIGKDIDEVARELKQSNCVSVTMGIQSASPKTSKLFRRYFDKKLLLAVASAFAKERIIITYDIIMENPLEEERDVAETVSTILELPHPFAVNPFYMTFFPKYQITEEAERKGLKKGYAGDTRVNRKCVSLEEWVIQLAQLPFVPRRALKSLYRNKSKGWARATIRILGKTLRIARPTRWLLMLRLVMANPQIVVRPLRRRFTLKKKK